MAVFTSVLRGPALVIDPGGKKPVKVGEGEYEYKMFTEIKVKFDDHSFDSSKYFNTHENDLVIRGWTEEKICDKIRANPRFGLEYFEVKPPSREEKIKAAKALKQQAEALLKEVDKLNPAEEGIPDIEKVLEGTPEDAKVAVETPKEKNYVQAKREANFKCRKCGFVARNKRGLELHLRKHTDLKEEAGTKFTL